MTNTKILTKKSYLSEKMLFVVIASALCVANRWLSSRLKVDSG